MWCAECGNAMVQNPNGSWNICCNGIAYWAKLAPLPKDKWWPVERHGDFYFFPSVKWPLAKKPTLPNV